MDDEQHTRGGRPTAAAARESRSVPPRDRCFRVGTKPGVSRRPATAAPIVLKSFQSGTIARPAKSARGCFLARSGSAARTAHPRARRSTRFRIVSGRRGCGLRTRSPLAGPGIRLRCLLACVASGCCRGTAPSFAGNRAWPRLSSRHPSHRQREAPVRPASCRRSDVQLRWTPATGPRYHLRSGVPLHTPCLRSCG